MQDRGFFIVRVEIGRSGWVGHLGCNKNVHFNLFIYKYLMLSYDAMFHIFTSVFLFSMERLYVHNFYTR